MNRDQWDLLARMNPTWGRIDLILDFESARSYIVGTGHSGSGRVPGTWNETTSKGIRVMSRIGDGAVLLDLPWAVVRDWSRSLSDATRAEAARLRTKSREIRDSFPKPYPGIGHGYAWDLDDATDEEIAVDRAALAEVNAKLDAERDAYYVRQRTHEAEVRAFLDTLGPSDEPEDLLELIEAMTA